MKMVISASIVAYNNNRNQLKQTIQSFLNTMLPVKLYVIDNSETNALETLCQESQNNSEKIEYFNGKNVSLG
jgi:hypothetical protein